MARTFSSVGNLSRTTNPPISSLPCTMAAWFKVTGASDSGFIIQVGDNISSHYYGLAYNAASDVDGYVFAGATTNTITFLTTVSTNVWHHLCLVVESNTVRSLFYDGGNKTAGSGVAITPTAPTNIVIGAVYSAGSPVNICTGTLAEIAVWDVALTDAEVAALAKYVPSTKVRPSDLIVYWPLMANATYLNNTFSNSTDRTLTLTGTQPTAADHPPVAPAYGAFNPPLGIRLTGYPQILRSGSCFPAIRQQTRIITY